MGKTGRVRAQQEVFIGLDLTAGGAVWTLNQIATVQDFASRQKPVDKFQTEVHMVRVPSTLSTQKAPVNITDR